jgi:hypothetical protein
MKKSIITVCAFFAFFAFTVAGVMAQDWTWKTYPTTAKITRMTVDPVSDAIYGIDAVSPYQVISVLRGEEITTGLAGIPAVEDTVPNDIVAGSAGKVYVVFDARVTDWTEGPIYADLALQPTVPDTDQNGTCKYIAAGKDGKLFVYYEAVNQYILVGTPPVLADAATIKFSPQTLNLSSKGNWVSVQIQLPGTLDENLIIPEEVRITEIGVTGYPAASVEIFPAPGAPFGIGENDAGVQVLKLKFARYDKSGAAGDQSLTSQLQSILTGANKGKYAVALIVTGPLTNGDWFQGTATFNANVTKKIK